MRHDWRRGQVLRVVSRAASWVALGAAAALAGCSVSQPFPDRATFALNPGAPVKASATQAAATEAGTARAHAKLTLRVMPLRIAKPYDSQLFNYKIGPEQFTQDYYAGFIAPPADLLGPQMIGWLEDSGAVQYAAPAGSALDCAAILEADVSALYADRTDHRAVMNMRVFVLSNVGGPTQVLMEKTYRQAEPLSSLSAEALVTAWSTAYRKTLEKLAADLAALPVVKP